MNFRITIIFYLLLVSTVYFAQSNVNLENRYRLAQTYERSGDFERAENIYKELVGIQPWNQRFVKSLNDLFLNTKKYDESIDLLNKAILVNANDISSYGMLGTTYYVMGDQQRAFDIWDSAIKLNNGNQVNYRIIANFAIENRAFDKAVEYLSAGKKIASDPKIYSFDLANIYTANMKYKEATYEYCSIIDLEPLQLEIVKRRIAAYADRPGAAELAEEAVRTYLEQKNIKPLKELLVFIFTSSKQYEKAFDIIIDMDKSSQNQGFIVFNYAQEFYINNDLNTAAKCYSYILNNYQKSPVYAQAKIGYAKTSEALIESGNNGTNEDWKPVKLKNDLHSGEYDKVIKSYEEIIELFPNIEVTAEALYRIARIYFEEKLMPGKAIENINKLTEKYSMTRFYYKALELSGDIRVFNGELDSARDDYIKAKYSSGLTDDEKKQLQYKISKTYFWQGRFQNTLENLSGLTENLRNDFANDAIEMSFIINTGRKDSLNLVLFADASLLEARKKFDEASVLYSELAKVNSITLSKIAVFRNAIMLTAMNKYEEALKELKDIIDNDWTGFNKEKSLFLSAQIYQYALNDSIKARDMYQNILENYPNSLYFDRSRELIEKLINNNG